jgi:putative endonuclease
MWYIYIVRASDNTLYTGITTDIARRISEHNGLSTKEGSKYLRPRRPVTLEYSEGYPNRSEASKREHIIKKLSHTEKITLISGAYMR